MEEEKKAEGSFIEIYEALLRAQLRVIRQFKAGKEQVRRLRKDGSMTKMGMVLDILSRAHRPMHISEIIAAVKSTYGIELDRESLVSALVKKVQRRQGVMRTGPNTFEATGK